MQLKNKFWCKSFTQRKSWWIQNMERWPLLPPIDFTPQMSTVEAQGQIHEPEPESWGRC